MLTLENISKEYTKGIHVLRNINLHIESGDMVFVVGLSGAGKTTLVRLITREEKPTEGTVKILDTKKQRLINIEDYKPHIYRRKLGIVFQDDKLIENKSAFDNVAYPLYVLGENHRRINERVTEIMRMIGIDYLQDKLPSELSGGEKHRVGIARAIINRPSILLADEPTSNLDYKTSNDIMSLLSYINKTGTTIIMVTHDTNAVGNSAGRILQIHDGQIATDIRKK